MNKKTAIALSALIAAGIGSMTLSTTAGASGFGPMNMMNPSKWFGGNKNRRYDDYYDGPGYGGGYPPPGYGYGYGGPGYGGPGYGAPYGAPLQPGYTAPPAATAPDASDSGSAERIKELEERIRQLESSQRQPPMQPQGFGPQAPQGYGAGQPPAAGGGMYPPSMQQGGGYPGVGGGYPGGQQAPAFRPTN